MDTKNKLNDGLPTDKAAWEKQDKADVKDEPVSNASSTVTIESLGLTPDSTIGERLRALRTYLHISLAELARQSHMTSRVISYYEANERIPSVDAIKKISTAMCAPISFFINDAEFERQRQDEAFLAEAKEMFDSKGKAQAKRLLEETNALFAGGELSDAEQTDFIDEMQELFVTAKKRAKEKHTPKKYRENEEE